ncbi:amidohydrolase family protein [Qipengyuania sp. 6D47A]|uniref:Amidohydrolase family protein n=2 Tax=Qipengyuania qiaonensis TaxID=2867240 RepID=A0ABS7J2H5_9SPHN|nr:amidohydrolase family protein [Qipengyuania qiaonensis]
MFGLLFGALLLSPVPVAAQDKVFDMHVHLHHGGQSVAAYDEQNAEDGVPVTAFGAMWFGGPNQAREGDLDAIRRGNDHVLTLARQDSRVLPIGTVHPYDGEQGIVELERIAGLGIRVLKLHPHTQGFDASDPRVENLVRRAGELDVTVLFDNAGIVPDDNVKLFNLALACPDTTFVFAHMGALGFRFWNLLPMARTAEGLFGENINFDISAIVTLIPESPLAEEFVWTIRNVGIDHVLLGSDFPQFSWGSTLEAFEKLGLTEEEKQKILYGNAQRLFGLE